MAEPKRKMGRSGAVETGVATELADKDSKTVILEGTCADLKSENLDDHVPEGYERVRATFTPTGGGMGRLAINCIKYDSGSEESTEPVRATIAIDMEEVTYDLADHPALKKVRAVCEKWLATDAAKRTKTEDDKTKYYYTDADGTESEVEDETAKKFCAAYMAGIKQFVRYYPVIEKHSIYKNPPGLTRNGRSFTSGSPKFSADCGTFSEPPVTLSGYAATNWYKGGDRWRERGDNTWELTEKWTYTPEGSDGEHAWIYTTIDGEEEEEE